MPQHQQFFKTPRSHAGLASGKRFMDLSGGVAGLAAYAVLLMALISAPAAMSPLSAQQRGSGLFEALKEFVQLDYLGMGTENHITSPTLFADRIDYYGKSRIDRDTMMRKRLAYYDKWPVRSYMMLPDTFRVAERDADTVDITFNYRFEVASNTRRVGGLGRTNLTVRLDDVGGFTITRESGKVIERF
ncbi:MAG: hypothetical protein AAFV45_03185 [Pseudomonadota bacterium]